MLKVPPLGGRERVVPLECPDAEQQEVIEIDDAAAALFLFVELPERSDDWEAQSWLTSGGLGFGHIVSGLQRPSFCPLDFGGEIHRLEPRLTVVPQERRKQSDLAVEKSWRRLVHVSPSPSELGIRHPVEGARSDLVADAELGQART